MQLIIKYTLLIPLFSKYPTINCSPVNSLCNFSFFDNFHTHSFIYLTNKFCPSPFCMFVWQLCLVIQTIFLTVLNGPAVCSVI